MENVILFGAGDRCYQLLRRIQDHPSIFSGVNVIAISDSNSNVIGKKKDSWTVIKPQDISCYQFDRIIVTPDNHFEEIVNQLTGMSGVTEDKIIHSREFVRNRFIQRQYELLYPQKVPTGLRQHLEKIVVYSAVFGDYDNPVDPEFLTPDCDYVLFTDNPRCKSDIWDVRYVKDDLEPALWVRKYKCQPHIFFPEYNTSIWIDANLRIVGNLRTLLERYMVYSSILLFPHVERNCLFEEASKILQLGLAPKQHIVNQVGTYFSDGFPQDNGLMCGGVIVREHNNTVVQKTMEDWWGEIQRFTTRDQISLPYVLWKNKCPYDLCREDIYKNEWIYWTSHKSFRQL